MDVNIKCAAQKCTFIRHVNISNNGGTHCCLSCKLNNNIHGVRCAKSPYIEEVCNICNIIQKYDICNPWPRDNVRCSNCYSLVRERAVKYVLDTYYNNFKNKKIHQSSPCGPLHNLFLTFPEYSYSHYIKSVENGSYLNGIQCVNLEKIPFPDNTYDIFLTMDVFEHLFNPEIAIKEIYRVLKPGGVYIMTVPIENLESKTEKACFLDSENKVVHIPTNRSSIKQVELEYHGNPIDNSGSVVTYYYGYDIINMIESETNFKCKNFFKRKEDNINELGILGTFKDVFVCKK